MNTEQSLTDDFHSINNFLSAQLFRKALIQISHFSFYGQIHLNDKEPSTNGMIDVVLLNPEYLLGWGFLCDNNKRDKWI